jgi:hypothetical protein
MSNPALNRLLRSGGLRELHVGPPGGVRAGGLPAAAVFSGEATFTTRYLASAKSGEGAHEKPDFSKKEEREETKKRKKEDSDEEDEEGPHYKSDGIHAKGADADGDGRVGEGKNKKKPDFKKDSNKNGKPDAFEK